MSPNQKPYSGKALDGKSVRDHVYSLSKDQYRGAILQKNELTETISPYYPSEELKAAVEYARVLQRPLLLRGEPGCGKTKLAQALAYELYHDELDHKGNPINYRNHYTKQK